MSRFHPEESESITIIVHSMFLLCISSTTRTSVIVVFTFSYPANNFVVIPSTWPPAWVAAEDTAPH